MTVLSQGRLWPAICWHSRSASSFGGKTSAFPSLTLQVPSTDLGVHVVRLVCGQAARVGRTSPELLAKYGLAPDQRKLARASGGRGDKRRVLEMIIHAGGDCVDFVLHAEHVHDRGVRAGQRGAAVTEIVVIIFEIR